MNATPASHASAPTPSSTVSCPGDFAETALSVQEARVQILAAAHLCGAEILPLHAAAGRVLAAPIFAAEDSPVRDTSAVDGYAIAAGLGAGLNQIFRPVGEAAAGRRYCGDLKAGDCVRIFTGALVPAGATSVVMQEDVEVNEEGILVKNSAGTRHILARGENHLRGSEVLQAGTPLHALELALLASLGVTEPTVYRVARVAHVVTGTELVDPATTPSLEQVRDCNSALVAALVAREGAELVAQVRLPDDLAACAAAIQALPPHDVLLISGGAGNGRYDLAWPLLQQLGCTMHFRSVRMRPGKPLGFATRGAQLIFVLPGNPVSHWATWQLLVGPALRQSAGVNVPAVGQRLVGQLAAPWRVASDGREVYWPARVELTSSGWRVWPARFRSSGDLSGVVGANALVWAGVAESALPAEASVEFLLLS